VLRHLLYFRAHTEAGTFMLNPGTHIRRLVLCCAILAVLWPARSSAADWTHFGFLYDHFDLTLQSGHRTEALGPLFYLQQSDTEKLWAIPPLMSNLSDPGTQRHEFDFAYPIMTYRRYGTEWRWQLIQIFAFAGGSDPEQNQARRFTLFPFYFQQRSPIPDQNYTAVGPFYGHMQNHLFRDDIFFVMFPLYSRTRKADIVTYNYFYPFVSKRYGNGLTGWKVWPIIGHEHKDVTYSTNGFGDVQTIGGHDSRFRLWPFYLADDSGIGTTNPVRQRAVLPIYSTVRSPERDSTTVIWPFFSHIVDREKKYDEWQTPWPLVDFAKGEGKTTKRVWPFFSQAHTAYLESDWYLWPVYKFNRVHSDPLDRTRTRILFFLYSDTITKNTETQHYRQRRDFWPLYTHRQDFDGSSYFQIFAPLEPILPTSKSVDRDYSPVWSVWRGERNPQTGASSQSLLWNLFRHQTTPKSTKCSFLFGLFQYQSSTDGRRVRLFYIPVLNTKPGTH